jgi:hypothetical protein
MKEQFVSYEIALELKKLGFKEECLAKYCRYNPTDNIELFPHSQNFFDGYFDGCVNAFKEDKIAAPLWQQVIDWFRDVHGINIQLDVRDNPMVENIPSKYIMCVSKNIKGVVVNNYYEEREKAVLKAIELLKAK